jgi:hypothetical protein
MTTDKQNPTQQRQQPQSLSQALLPLSTRDLGLPVRSMLNSSWRDHKEELAFLQSILKQAIEITNDFDYCFSKDSSSNNTDDDEEEEENSRSPNRNQ